MRIWLAFLVICCSFVYGEERNTPFAESETEVMIIPEGMVVRGSYWRAGNAHWIAGTVKGDVILIGSQVVIDGIVDGDLLVMGGSVIIRGKVTGSARILSGECSVQGEVEKGLFIASGVTAVGGVVHGDLVAISGLATIQGAVLGNARAFAGQLEISSSARVMGNLLYRSYHTASISPEAKISGQVIYTPSFLDDLKKLPGIHRVIIGSKIVAILMNFCYTFLIGLILLRYYPHRVQRAIRVLEKNPITCLFVGFCTAILLPILFIGLLISVIGAPFGLTLMGLNVVGFYTVKIFPVLLGGSYLLNWIKKRKNQVLGLMAGLILYYFISLVPFVGWFFSSLTMFLGLGAVIKAQTRRRPKVRKA